MVLVMAVSKELPKCNTIAHKIKFLLGCKEAWDSLSKVTTDYMLNISC